MQNELMEIQLKISSSVAPELIVVSLLICITGISDMWFVTIV